MKRIALTPIAFAAACLAGAAWAQTPVVRTLPQVVVTPGPIIEANQVDAYSTFSTRVTDAQVKDLTALDLAAALRMTPGVQISRYDEVGSYNGNQGGAIYIRGLGASRPGSEIKTYVDGLPFYMGVWNHPLLDLLPLNGMQAITIHKSPQLHESGNNFASINLETRRATTEGVHGQAHLAAGSYGTLVTQAQLAGKRGGLDFSLAAGRITSDGHVTNSDARLANAVGRVGMKLNEHWSVGAGFVAVSNEAGDPLVTTPAARDDSSAHALHLALQHTHGDWRGEIKVYDNRGNNDLANDGVWGTFKTRFHLSGVRWKEEFKPWQGGSVVAGIDHERVAGEIAGPWVGGGAPWTGPTNGTATLPSMTTNSAYAVVSHSVAMGGGWTAVPSAGLRHYRASQAASRTAPQAGLSLVSDRVTVYANYAEGVLYPGMETRALAQAIPFMFAANNRADILTASVDKHKEIGVKFTPDARTQIDLSLFRDDVRNRYVWTAPTGPGSGTFSNTYGNYHLQGAELSVQWQVAQDWRVFTGWTALKASVDTQPYAPRNAFTVGVNGRVGPVRVVMDAQHQSAMYAMSLDRDSSVTNQRVDGFSVANARLSYPLPALGKSGEVYLALNNLFNARYEYNPGYVMPGRNARVGVLASF